MAKIAHKIPEKCAIFHIIIFSDITTAQASEEPNLSDAVITRMFVIIQVPGKRLLIPTQQKKTVI